MYRRFRSFLQLKYLRVHPNTSSDTVSILLGVFLASGSHSSFGVIVVILQSTHLLHPFTDFYRKMKKKFGTLQPILRNVIVVIDNKLSLLHPVKQ